MIAERVTTESDALHARVRAFIAASARGAAAEPLDALAADIARFQIANVAPIARLARARGVSAADLRAAADVPAIPTDVFRFARVAAHPPELDVAVFCTSGTTSGERGRHAFRTLATYDAAALAWGGRHLFPGRADRVVLSLTPPPSDAPDSSLVHMIALFAAAQTGPTTYHLRGGALDLAAVERACRDARAAARPALLFGAAFAFVHLLDAAPRPDLRLPEGSAAMLTGGFKGRSREVPADELRAAIAAAFDLPDRSVVGEYGMTELSSQLYEPTLERTHAPRGVYAPPPWARVTAVHPETLEPLPDGEPGLARILDLANVDSAVAVQTADRVRVTADGVELLGRQPGAVPRGCSLAVEEALG